jgi:hypothetical protein
MKKKEKYYMFLSMKDIKMIAKKNKHFITFFWLETGIQIMMIYLVSLQSGIFNIYLYTDLKKCEKEIENACR